MDKKNLIHSLKNISVFEDHTGRAPHKPIMLLYALAQLQAGNTSVGFNDIYKPVEKILKSILPHRQKVNSLYPFWYLRSDGIWQISDISKLTQRKGKAEPLKSELKRFNIQAGFTEEVISLYRNIPDLISETATVILDENFPESIQDDIIELIPGLNIEPTCRSRSRNRDPKFRRRILIAYGYACAVCGYSIKLNDQFVGLEAAHIKWHQAGGPDTEDNGLGLCSIHHKLFDRGVFAMDKDMRLVVSDYANGDMSQDLIFRYEGHQIALPRKREYYPNQNFLSWHRDKIFIG